MKVVMTGSADDGPDWLPQICSKDKRRKLANRFMDGKDPVLIVIVRAMWPTSFDAPCLHAMYARRDDPGAPTFEIALAIAVMPEEHGINGGKWKRGKHAERLALIPAGQVKRRSFGGAADTQARSASAGPQRKRSKKSNLYPSCFIRLLAGLLGQCL